MRKLLLAAIFAGGLVACSRSADDTASHAAAKPAVAKKKASYCFFEDKGMKGWSAKRGKDGNILVKGKAYRQDSRYKATFGPAVITGAAAEISPTIVQNDTGFAAPDDWWDVSQTISGSAAVTSLAVTCGGKTLATLSVPAKS